MPHKRNGRLAKERRQARANGSSQSGERLLLSIFGEMEECLECRNLKSVRQDCMTPHCMTLRYEESEFYEKVTDDYIMINGAAMFKGVDY